MSDRAGRSEATLDSQAKRRYPYGLLLPFAVVILLAVAGYLIPSIYTWGINIWNSFPWPYLALVIILAFGCATPVTAKLSFRLLTSLIDRIASLNASLRGVSVAAISAAVGALSIVFRSRAAIYGDGYTVVANSVSPVFAPPGTFHETIKIVPVIIYRLGATLLSKQWNLDPQLAFGIVSSIGGLFGFWGLWRLARAVGQETGRSVALMMAGLAGGGTVLFFGHLELYTWGIAVLLWLLAATIDFLNGRTRKQVVWIWLVVAAAMQMLFLPTLVIIALVLLTLRRKPEGNSVALTHGLSPKLLGWALAVCSVLGGLFFSLVLTQYSFVHLWPVEGNPYWAFSIAHLADLLNLIFLTAPLLLTALAMSFSKTLRKSLQGLALAEKLLGIFVLSLFLVTFWLDPGLGAIRDWDLLSFFGFPASIFAGLLLLRPFTSKSGEAILAGLCLGLFVLVPLPHIIDRTDCDRALARIDPMVWADTHYQPSYDLAHGTIPWAGTIQTFTGHPELADKYLWRKVEADPSAGMAWFNLGEIELERRHFDSAAAVLERAYLLLPGSDVVVARYAEALQDLGRRSELEPLLPRLEGMHSNNPKALGYAGIVLATEGRVAQAIPLFRTAHELRPWEYGHRMNLGMAFFQMAQYDSAVFYWRSALPILPVADRPNAFRALIQSQIELKRFDDARSSLDEYRRQFPGDPNLAKIQTVLDRQR